jgi:hypothetical protein
MITCLSFRTGLLYNILEHIFSQCGDLRMFAHKKKMKFISNMNLTKTTYYFMLRYICPSSSFNGEFNIWAPEFAHIHSLIYLVSKDMDRTCINWSNNFCFTIDFTKSFLICIWSFQIKLNPISSKIDFIYLIHLKSA